MSQTLAFDLPALLPQSPDCECCAGHLLDALGVRGGISARRDASRLLIEAEDGLAAADVEALARDAGRQVADRYQHPTFVVDGMDCGECAAKIERALSRHRGVHYAVVNLTAATLRLEYDRQATSLDSIMALVNRLGYNLRSTTGDRPLTGASHAADTCSLPQAESTPRRPLATRWERARPRDVATALSAVLIVLAWGAGLAGAALPSNGLYVVATLVGGAFVARSGWANLRATRSLDINALMTIAATGALLLGDYVEAAAVVFLFALGNALEGYTMDRARRSIRALMRLAPDRALVVRDGREETVPAAEVGVGELLIVRPGERIALDGTIVGGSSYVDQSPITGESVPVARDAGTEVFAGTINGDGALEVEVSRTAQHSTLARIIHLVEEAQARRAPAQRFVDAFARVYTPAVIVLALAVALAPPLLLGGSWAEWINRALVLLVIACPCALVISTPVSIVSAIAAAARSGVLFKGGAALETAGALRAVAFDKTGTLTAGRPIVTDVIVAGAGREDDLLRLAAAVERRSTHPLARAIVAAAEERGLDLPPVAGFQSSGGRGARGVVEGHEVLVGNRAMLGEVQVPPELQARVEELERAGRTPVFVARGGRAGGLLALADEPRAEAGAAVAALRRLGVRHVAMLTGDGEPVARRVAEATGVDEARAGLLPHEKLDAVDDLAARYGRVAMVGDGVNDAPALARAPLGVAMGAAGSDAALETADVVLMTDDLARLPYAVRLGRSARRVIVQNVTFALAIKAVFLLATLFGAATLWMAVMADTGAALVVIANGMRLLRYRLPG